MVVNGPNMSGLIATADVTAANLPKAEVCYTNVLHSKGKRVPKNWTSVHKMDGKCIYTYLYSIAFIFTILPKGSTFILLLWSYS